jgi:hypothetical protein
MKKLLLNPIFFVPCISILYLIFMDSFEARIVISLAIFAVCAYTAMVNIKSSYKIFTFIGILSIFMYAIAIAVVVYLFVSINNPLEYFVILILISIFYIAVWGKISKSR